MDESGLKLVRWKLRRGKGDAGLESWVVDMVICGWICFKERAAATIAGWIVSGLSIWFEVLHTLLIQISLSCLVMSLMQTCWVGHGLRWKEMPLPRKASLLA